MPGLPLPFPIDSTPNQTSSFPSLSRPQATASQLFLPAPLTPLTTSAINCFVNLQTRTRTLSTHLLHSYLSFGLDQRKIIKLWPESLWKFMVYHLSSTLIPKTHKSYSTILSLLLDWPPPTIKIASYFTSSCCQMFLPLPHPQQLLPLLHVRVYLTPLLAQRNCYPFCPRAPKNTF